MGKHMRYLGLVILCASGTAIAAPKLEPAADAKPPRFVEESSVFFSVSGAGDDDGWWVSAAAEIGGLQKGDRVRLDVKKGGKVVAAIECTTSGAGTTVGLDLWECGGSNKRIKKGQPTGAIEADLIFEDDATDKHYVLRTFKGNVKLFSKRSAQVEADDTLAVAYLVNSNASKGGKPRLRFWIAGKSFTAQLRCTVGGKLIPDIEGDGDAKHEIEATTQPKGNYVTWRWSRIEFDGTFWDGKPDGNKLKDYVYMTDHPGEWSCQLRREGIVLREFRFKVNAKGDAEPHPMQLAKGAPAHAPGIAMIEMKIPAGNGLDQRIKPVAIKKSRGFGLAWPQHDSLKAMLASLPPAYENAEPVASQKKAAGKLIVGTEAKPPRLIDESSSVVSIYRLDDGYEVRNSQLVYGVSQAKANTYRLEWKQGAKTLGKIKCSWQQSSDRDSDVARVECNDRNQKFTAKGPVEGHLIMADDSDGNEYLLRVYKVNAFKFTNAADPTWQIVPDDVLATAWVHHTEANTRIRFWMAQSDTSVELRCTVNGNKIPDIRMSGTDGDHTIEAETYTKPKRGGEQIKYIWQQAGGGGTDVLPGLPPKDYKPSADRVGYLGEHPGKWDCNVRQKGKVLRQLLFTVNAKGYVDADPSQLPSPAPDWIVPIEIRFGKDAADVRVRPDAMKKSRGFGLPWPKPPTKPFPKASGLPDPK